MLTEDPKITPTALYLIEGMNDNGIVKSVYVGITNNPARRMAQHLEQGGVIWNMLDGYRSTQVGVYGEWFASRVHAALAEREKYRWILKADKFRSSEIVNQQVPYDSTALQNVLIVDGHDYHALTMGTEHIDRDIDNAHWTRWYFHRDLEPKEQP